MPAEYSISTVKGVQATVARHKCLAIPLPELAVMTVPLSKTHLSVIIPLQNPATKDNSWIENIAIDVAEAGGVLNLSA